MADSPVTSNDAPSNLEERLSLIESALKLDERLNSLETTLVSNKRFSPPEKPWWRDSKTITILGALLAAVIPLVTAIDGILKNARESQRALVDQQDKIRQTYLDRVLKSGIAEDEQQRIFNLLSKLKSDPEFQEWANEERNKAIQKIGELNAEKSLLEAQNRELLSQLDSEKRNSSTLDRSQRAQANLRVQQLERAVAQSQRRVSEIRQRIGEPVNTAEATISSTANPVDINTTATEVTFLSTPPGAEVYLITGMMAYLPEGPVTVKLGVTPFTSRQVPGYREYRFIRGDKVIEKAVEINQGKTTVKVDFN